MIETLQNVSPVIAVVSVILAVALAVAWLLLPLAVYGIKARLDHQTALLREIVKQDRNKNIE